MCTVSMIGDHYHDKWRDLVQPYTPQPWETDPPPRDRTPRDMTRVVLPVSREEFDQLKRDVEEMKALLKRAKEYDERNGEPDCEIEEKMVTLRKIADAVGIDLDGVIGGKTAS